MTVPELPGGTGRADDPVLRHAVVVESGPLGVSLSVALLEAGLSVTLIEADPGALERAGHAQQRMLARHCPDAATTTAAPASCRLTSALAASDPAAFVFAPAADLHWHARRGDIPICLGEIPDASPMQPVMAVGFAVPVQASDLVEVVPAAQDPATREAVLSLLAALGKQPVVGPGFRVPALHTALALVADDLMLRATTPWELDSAMIDFGFSAGVCETQDGEGLDAVLVRLRTCSPSRPGPILPRMVAEGRLGRKAGVGWYRYPGGGGLVIDPLIEDLIREEARFAGVRRHELSGPQMTERLCLGLINAAAAHLSTEPAHSAAAINLLSVSVLGFPRATGGLLRHADRLGAGAVLELLRTLSRDEPQMPLWHPCPQVERIARDGGSFNPA